MGLPVKKEINSYLEDANMMAEAISEEDAKMFIINNRRSIKRPSVPFGHYHHPKENIADYFKANRSLDLNTRKIEQFLEQGVLDNVLFNFLFSRGMGLKDGLIDIDRAYLMIRKINENELDFPEKVPDQPLTSDEKLDIVCGFLRKHPDLLLQALPDSKEEQQKISLFDHRMKTGKGSLFPKSAKTKKSPKKFRTLERDGFAPNAYTGNLHSFHKSKLLKDRNGSNSPAVPIPTYTRLPSHSNKMRISSDRSLLSDFKMVSKGINFKIEPEQFENVKNSSLSQTRATKSDIRSAKLRIQSRATTSELHKRNGGLIKIESGSKKDQKITNTQIIEKRMKSRPLTKVQQKRVRSNFDNHKPNFNSNHYIANL
jgi:hypothetical protein